MSTELFRCLVCLPVVAIRKAFCVILLVVCITGQVVPASAESDTWTSLGPQGGTILALAIDPVTPTTLYAGTDRGGVFKSINSGGTWNPVNTGLGNFYVSGLMIDPLTPTTLYAITRGDVYKSTNGGGNWSAIGFDMWYGYQELYDLTIDPSTPTTLYSWINGLGLFKSTNSGEDWDEIVTDLDEVHFLAVDPLTPTTLHAIAKNGDVYVSTNGGENWTALSTDLRSVGNIYVLVINPITPSSMYAGTAGGVYKSINGGIHWSKAGTVGSTLALVINPVTPSILYAGTQLYSGIGGVFKSTNGGGSWTQVNNGIDPSQTTVCSLAINPLTPSTLYAGTCPIYGRSDGGVFKSTNGGGNWSASNTKLMNTDISALAIDPATPRILYAASHTQGIYKSINGGGSWSVINNGLPFIKVITSLAIDPLTPTTLYAGTGSSGIYKSTNGGGSWTEVNTGLNIAFEYYISVLAIDPATPATLYAGTADGVVRSTNGGGNWINIGLADKDVNALVIDPAAPGTLYAGTYMQGVYKSTNGGGDWNPVNNGLTDDLVYALAINPLTPATLYAGTDMGGVFKSTDGGDNWYPANTGLPPYPGFPDDHLTVNSLVIDPLMPTTLYAGLGWRPGSTTYPNLEGGVFKSTDGGETWNTVGSGLTGYYINALAINHAAPADMYAATDGGGIAALNNIIIHPSILTFKSIGAQDGRMLESAENSNKGGTMNATASTLVLGDNAQKKQYRSILSFSTKGLPDKAFITKITLKVKKQGVVGGGNPVTAFQGFLVDIRKGFYGPAAGLQAGDFQAKADKGYGPFKPALSGGWYTLNLTPAKAYINKLSSGGGVTQIRLRFKLDDNNNTIANYLSLYSGNAATASRPQLIVEYYFP